MSDENRRQEARWESQEPPKAVTKMENPRGRSGGLLEALRGDEPAKTRQTLKAMFFGGVVLVAGSYGYLAGVEPDPAAIPDFTIAYLAVGAGVGVALTAGLALQMDEQEDSNDE